MNNAKAMAKAFVKKYKYYEPILQELYRIIAAQGYTIVEYNSICNDDDVENIIKSLNLEEPVKKTRGFTYVNEDLRLVFINEDLSDDEKLVVLLHEEGHIFCDHISKINVIGNDVQQEQEANDFAYYIMHMKLRGKLLKHKKKILSVAIALIIAISGIVVGKFIAVQLSYYGEYYVTNTGSKYHVKECGYVHNKTNVRRLTKDDYNSGKFVACMKCIGE